MTTQIKKPNAPPNSAEMSSKLGIVIAIMTATAVTSIRKNAFRRDVRSFDWLKRFGLRSAARGSTREYTSIVETIGAALEPASAVQWYVASL